MTKIKICGITDMKEVGFLNKYRPDYAGFVFAESRRRVTAEQAAMLGAGLSEGIRKVGVFVDQEVRSVAAVAGQAGLDAVQLHGDEGRDYVELLRPLLKPGVEIWKALHIDAEHMPTQELLNMPEIDKLLLDTFVAGSCGGTGKCFDWELVLKLELKKPFILAGGLNPGNVGRAVRLVSPYAVDASSGVERDGLKDGQKLQAFIEAARGDATNE